MVSSTIRFLALAASAATVKASCAHNTHLSPREEGGAVKINTFGYAGTIGPVNWLSLDPAANIMCATGTNQSPIDMVQGQFTLIPASTVNLQIPDFTEGTEFENLGTTVEVIAKGGTMALNGTNFNLKQFHFHLPSEHLDNGVSQAMEMHMVWEGEGGRIAVIGAYIQIAGSESGGARPIVEAPATNITAPRTRRSFRTTPRSGGLRPLPNAGGNAPATSAPSAPASNAPAGGAAELPQANRTTLAPIGEGVTVGAASGATVVLETVFSSVGQIRTPGTVTKTQPLIMSEIVQKISAGNFQAYSGSLTTPPCSEGVQWLVATEKLAISVASFTAARDVIGFNSRFPQNALMQPNLLAVANVAAGMAAAPASAPSAPAAPGSAPVEA